MQFISLAIAASVQSSPAEPPALSLRAIAEDADCRSAKPQELVVCGARREAYRLDPAVLEAQRALDARKGESARAHDSANDRSCVPEGPNGCTGRDVIPLVAVALTAAKSAVLAAKGEDWREPLRTRPDEYAAYQSAKSKRNKPRVTIGFGRR